MKRNLLRPCIAIPMVFTRTPTIMKGSNARLVVAATDVSRNTKMARSSEDLWFANVTYARVEGSPGSADASKL